MPLPKKEKVEPISEKQREKIYGANKKSTLSIYIDKHCTQYKPVLKTVLSNLENETQITAVPADPTERKKFYASMRLNLEHIALKLSDPTVSEDLKKSALLGVKESAGYCGTRQFQEVSIARKMLEGDTSSSAGETPESFIENALYQLRAGIIDQIIASMIRASSSEGNVHYYNAVMALIGQETGVADSNTGCFRFLQAKLEQAKLVGTISVSIHRLRND